MHVGVRSDCVVLHVLKQAELVEDVDAELVDEKIIVFVLNTGTTSLATP